MSQPVEATDCSSSDDAWMPTAAGVIDDLTAFASGRDRIFIAEIIARLDRAGFPVLMLVLVLPALIPIPGPYGMVFGTIVALLASQMLAGLQRPWLPAFLTSRSLPAAPIIRGIKRIRGWIVWLESPSHASPLEEADRPQDEPISRLGHSASGDCDRPSHSVRQPLAGYRHRHDRACADLEGWFGAHTRYRRRCGGPRLDVRDTVVWQRSLRDDQGRFRATLVKSCSWKRRSRFKRSCCPPTCLREL